MNERIRELVKQSGGEFWQRIESDGVLNPEAYITFDPPESLAKFAESIVRECCDWIDGSPSTDAGQLLLTKSFIIANLKGHFGVGS